MTTSAPPPYRSGPSDSERLIANTPLKLTTGDLSGIRDQILDNAPTLFTLGHGVHHPVPTNFRINTFKSPDSGRHYACVVSQQTGLKGTTVLELFVQGPPADTTEVALKGLLEKMEAMIGRKWMEELQPALSRRILLRSVDE